MRSLTLFATLLAACGGSKASVKTERLAFDPELAEACVSDWQQAPAAACGTDDEGKTVLKDDDSSFRKVAQILALEKDSRGSRSMDEALVTLTTSALADGRASDCSRQIVRWHRALALQRLGRWKEAFVDFGTVVKDGPNSPFYKDVGAWIEKIEPHLPSGVVTACLASYDPPAPEVPKDKGDHWKPYAPGEEP